MNIIFLNCTQNYGYKFSAGNTKVEFLAKGLTEQDNSCTIHNGIIGYTKIKHRILKKEDKIGNIITYPRKCTQLFSWILNLPMLIKDLKKLHNPHTQNWIILEAPDFHIFCLYVILARIFEYKIAVISHEWLPTIKSTHPIRKPFIKLYTKTFGHMVDCILPISEFIIEHIQHFKKPYLKIPIIAEYDDLCIKDIIKRDFFLYCVYAAYTRVIYKVIDAFSLFHKENKKIKLILILSGTSRQISIIQDYIQQKGLKDSIDILHNIPYHQLFNLYREALGLIIPLDPSSIQDHARFSQKIAEYLSSGTPLISNNVGEIKHYFKNKQNIILCEFSVEGFAQGFSWIKNNPTRAKEIGLSGYSTGSKHFNYQIVCKKLNTFLKSLN